MSIHHRLNATKLINIPILKFFQSFSFQTQQNLQKVNVGAVQQGEWDALEKNRTQSSVNAVRRLESK